MHECGNHASRKTISNSQHCSQLALIVLLSRFSVQSTPHADGYTSTFQRGLIYVFHAFIYSTNSLLTSILIISTSTRCFPTLLTMIFRTILVVITIAARTTAQALAPEQCYHLNVSNPVPTTYIKCAKSNMCCRTNDKNTDTCIDDGPLAGLCKSRDFDIWRESCTDWTSDGCVQLCVNDYGTFRTEHKDVREG